MKRNVRISLVVSIFTILIFLTVVVFEFFDHRSHSASDTLRPFLITVVPVWLAALVGSRRILASTRRP